MNILQEALVALLSGLITKTGNEIHWEDECGYDITIEPTDISQEKYIIRCYHKNGQKWLETECQSGQRHGKSIGCCQNGIIRWEAEYKNGIEIK